MAYRFEVVAYRYRPLGAELVTLFEMFPTLEVLCSYHGHLFILYGTDLAQPLSEKAKRELGRCMEARSIAAYDFLDEKAVLQALTKKPG